ncbi:lipopolysaccharide glycosyltransferase, putative [Asanoa ishikariensis]|uniref:Glycosyltransferase involved in cell wall bisynthesis n=1 Tax=Asanoa ishikariensis TaxID=137265 RepID=A0A1H3RLM6_9ACTN|nr:GT4 family glycosyltransferase PelF [Asanoa ishikariensis]GIF67152.1 lipopolysaccharide glycosyltransferase, putative [Asanoa ishikariensis]SDZ25819.1 Glycosyltransferase involved in cell wall bisynthesis [Asanoa ishikariensis]
MRVALINEGTYPYAPGGVGTWCHQILNGLDGHEFHVVALTGHGGPREPAYPVPSSVTAVDTYPVWDRPITVSGGIARHRRRRAASAAAVLLCRGLLGDDPHSAGMFADGLRRLTELSGDGTHPLFGTELPEVLLDAWQASAGPAAGRPPLPRLSLRDARSAAVLLEHAVRPLACRTPRVDLCHPAAAGLPVLVALAAKWRAGTPFLLTEHGVYLRERYLEHGTGMPLAVKTVVLRFYRALARLGYEEAALVAAVSRFNQRWELRLGAHPAKVVVVPNGVEPLRYPPLATEPTVPTVTWVGRIDPLKDLHTLIRAMRTIRDAEPLARLRLAGPVPETGREYAASCLALIERLGLRDAVDLSGPVTCSRQAYADGHLVALSSISEGLPYTIIEAMMCGRPTVSTDVGGVSEVVGSTGLIVPPGDPVAFGQACLELLGDGERRRTLGAHGRDRALAHFTVDRMLAAYRQLYTDVRAAVAA